MEIQQSKLLTSYNTFGIGAVAKFFVEVNSVQQFTELTQTEVYKQHKKLVLGGGSNILFTQDFDGLVVKNALLGIEVVAETENQVVVKAASGEVWHRLVMWCIEQNYAGIENLSLIPGLVGAAPMQNIGAYGVEIKDVFEQLEALDMQTGELRQFNLSDCAFGYRESVFKNQLKDKYFITSVSFRLTKMNSAGAVYRLTTDYGDIKNTLSETRVYEPTIRDVSNAVIKIRQSKLPDPAMLGNAGSFFKNPSVGQEKFQELVARYPVMPSYVQKDNTYKIPAGWLIEQCGWKGKVVGNTGSHKSQALVLVNYGHASGNEIWKLAMDIKQSVKEKFGVDITPEVNVV